MRDFLEFCGVVLLGSGVVVGGIFVVANEYCEYMCDSYERTTQKETRYANFDACYVKTAEGFQRWDEYKLRAAASEGLKSR